MSLGSGPPQLLVEVPHGATRREHYDRLAGQLQGQLPDDLHAFFSMNTDVGAWALGEAVATRLVEQGAVGGALLIRCLIPRTFIDVNRTIGAAASDLTRGGITAAIPPYVTDPVDVDHLLDLHRRYTALAARAFTQVCGRGGLALVPHTYGPVSLPIDAVDRHIVTRLREAHRPEVLDPLPLRPEVDLITCTPTGEDLSPPGLAAALVTAFGAAGLTAVAGDTYSLMPGTMGALWAARHPGQVLILEVRRDLLVPAWTWNLEMIPAPDKVRRVAAPLAEELAKRFVV